MPDERKRRRRYSFLERVVLVALAVVLAILAVTVIDLLIGQDEVVTTVPAGACPDGKNRPAFRCEVNTIRRANGLKPLAVNLHLRAAATQHALDMVRHRYFSHTGPDGSPESRVRASGYLAGTRRWKIGENLAYGTGAKSRPSAIVNAWMKSPPHRANLLSKSYREGGGAIASGGGKTYYVLEFGVRR